MGFFRRNNNNALSDNEPRFNALKYEQSTYGAAKPVLYGTNRLCGNIIDSTDFKAVEHKETTRMGKGGQSNTTVSYTYTARTVIGLCEGTIDGVRKVIFDDGTYSLSDLNLNLFKGTSNQDVWGEMYSLHPERALHYRNLAYAAGNIVLTNSGSVPQFSFEISGKFTSNTDDMTPVITEGFNFSTSSGTLSSCSGVIDYSEYYLGMQNVEIVYYTANSQEVKNSHFTNYSLTSKNGKYNITFNLSGLGAVSCHAYVTYNSRVRLDANPKDIVKDILTNKIYGVGLDSSIINNTSLNNFSTYCIANNIFISPLYDSQAEAQEVLSDIAEIANSTFIWSQGELKVVPLGDETVSDNGKTYIPDLTPIYDLSEDDFLCDDGEEPINVTRKNQAEVKNSVKIEYLNRANNYNTEIAEAQDIADIELNGLKQADVLSAHQICTQEVAQKAAQIALQRNIAVRNKYLFKLSMRYILLEPTDIVTLTSARLGLNRELVKITSIAEKDGLLEIEAEEMIVGSASAARITTQNASYDAIDTSTSVGNINDPIIFEPPFDLTQNELQVWVGASSSQNLFGGAEVWISDDGETYVQAGQILGSIRQGVLSAPLPEINSSLDDINTLAVDVSMSNAELLSGTYQDMENLNTLCYVDGELVSYEDAELVSDNIYYLKTLKRGAYYTVPASHNIGTQFCRIDSDFFLKIPFAESDIGRKIFVKFCSFNTFNAGKQSLANVQAYEYIIQGNAKKIFPADVTNFNVIQKNDKYAFSWQITSIDDVYEIREGDNWENGSLVGKNIPLNSFESEIIMTGQKKFWIKAFNGTNYSDNPTSDVIYVESIPDSNVVVAYDLFTDLANGVFDNTKQYRNTIKLQPSIKWQSSLSLWGQGTEEDKYYQSNGIWGAKLKIEASFIDVGNLSDYEDLVCAGYVGEDIEYIDCGTLSSIAIDLIDCSYVGDDSIATVNNAVFEYIDCGTLDDIATDLIDCGYITIEDTNVGYYTSAVQDLGGVLESGIKGIFHILSDTEVEKVEFQIRYSTDNESWSAWKTLSDKGFEAIFRYYQCRIHFVSKGGQIVCDSANIIIDVPDKLITRTVTISDASEGAVVEYNFYAPPSIVATVNENINAYAVVIEKSSSSATIKLYDNDGTAVTGVADLIIKGY